VLKQQSSDKLTIFVIWEPILASDWSRPTRPVLGRISDDRVRQFWDKDHLVAKQLDKQLSSLQPNCCRNEGILWDLVALYPKGAHWDATPIFVDGPVAKVEDALTTRVQAISH
jgi:hypothetical protein